MSGDGDTFDPAEIGWVFDEDDLSHCFADIDNHEWVTFDLETTGLNEYSANARVVCAAITMEEHTWLIPGSHPESPFRGRWRAVIKELAEHLRPRKLIAHNGKYDCRYIYATTEIDISQSMAWDSQVSAHMMDENSSSKLKDRVPTIFKVDRWDDVDLTYECAAEKAPLLKLGEYAARDTYWTEKLAQYHRELMIYVGDPSTPDEVSIARLGLLMTFAGMPAVRTITAMEQRGMKIDIDWTRQLIDANGEKLSELWLGMITRYSDVDPERASLAPTSNWFREWSQVAIDRGDLEIVSLTGTGKPQWNKAALVRLDRRGYKLAKQLKDYRAMSKENEYLNSWLKFSTKDEEIHAHYNIGSVVTGRLSCSEPNLQQCKAILKPAYIARKRYYITEIDYSQIEMRVIAYMSRCEPMIRAFNEKQDLHRLLAVEITGKTASEVTAEERQQGKVANFGLAFQMGVDGLREYAETSYDVSFTLEQAQAIHDAYFETWTGLQDWQYSQIELAKRRGYAVSPIGRIRRLPDLYSGNDYLRGRAERGAINSPVQGFASDIMQIAAASIEGSRDGHRGVPEAQLLGTVHDSIVVEVPASDWKKTTARCMKLMFSVPEILTSMDCKFDIPLAAEAKIGTRWGLSDVGVIK